MPGPHGGARPFTQEQLSVAQRVCGLRQDAYYEILEVDEQASEAEIKRAFKLLALQLHPDKNAAPGAEDAFKLVAEAYEVLGNAQDRAAYDNERRGRFAAFNPGFFTNDDRDDFEYDDPPPFRPRTPAPNETRKQRRQREYEDRQARQRAKDHAERNARRREKERRRATRFRDMEDMLRFFAGRGMHFVYCEQCDSVHVQMGDEPEEHDPPPGPRRREPHTGRDQPADAADTRARPRDNQPAFPADDVPVDAEIPVPPRQQNPPRPASRDTPDSEKTSLLMECIVIALILAGVCLLAFILFKALRLVWATMKLIWTTSVGRGLLSLGLGVLYALFGPVCFAMLRYGRRGVFVIRGPGISRSGIHPVQFFTADDIFKMMPNM